MEIIGSTRVADKFIGWKNTDIYGGNNGFRQQSGTISNFYLAAIGDSFTYGYSVKNDETWSAVLKSLTNLEVYNFGVGGNGIFSYHYIVNNMIPKNKKIIIGLFLGNDFINKGYACNIDFNTDFWMKEVERLSLVKPTCATSNKKQTQLNFFHKLINHSAFVNRIYDIVSRLVIPSK